MALDWNWERAQIGVGSFNVTKRKLSTMDGWVLVRKMVLRLKHKKLSELKLSLEVQSIILKFTWVAAPSFFKAWISIF